MYIEEWDDERQPLRPPDPMQEQAEAELRAFFDRHPEEVFSSRQVELAFEDTYFHWITNRAIRSLVDQRVLASEEAVLQFGGRIKLVWKRSYRFYRRSAKRVVSLVSEYSTPDFTAALGQQGESMVLEAFARNRFVVLGRNTRVHGNRVWNESEHDLDLLVERDGVVYGVEVKNTLAYIRQEDFEAKRQICRALGVRPVFAVRMMPKSWIFDLLQDDGYAMILKTQFYPWGKKELAQRVAAELRLPVVCAGAIEQGVMDRFLLRHNVNLRSNSQRTG